MKTAISIPDPLFKAAERAAKRQKVSRSRFYAQAVASYLKAHRDKEITAKLNAIYSTEPSDLDPDLGAAASQLLSGEKW